MVEINQVSNLMNYRTQLQDAMSTSRIQQGLGAVEQQDGKQVPTFSDYLGKAVDALNQNMNTMNQSTTDMITGNQSDLGQVMINMTEAQLSLQTAIQIRNKCLESYNDLKNMQI